tara:strand:+ start:1247 stop:1375 length:129 start_codon:yes stop_codon:yes gene_type:complete
MPTEGTGIKPPYPEDKPMAQVTYRGSSTTPASQSSQAATSQN